MKNKHIARKKLTQEDIVKEVTALQDMGHKRLAIEAGEDPVNNPIDIFWSVSIQSTASNIKTAQSAVSMSISLQRQWRINEVKGCRNRNLYPVSGDLS